MKFLKYVCSVLFVLISTQSVFADIPATLNTWYTMPGTAIGTACPTNVQRPDLYFGSLSPCVAIIDQWGGGMFDTKRSRLVMRGGGHNTYYGSEAYGLNVITPGTSTMAQVMAPPPASAMPPPDGTGVLNNGMPASRHTYSNLAYDPVNDLYWMYGGSTDLNGQFMDDLWKLDPKTGTQTRVRSAVGLLSGSGAVSAGLVWDSNQQKLWLHDCWTTAEYLPSTDTLTLHAHGNGCMDSNTSNLWYTSWFFDHKRNRYVGVGLGDFITFNTTNNASWNWGTLTTTGGTSCVNAKAPGFTYDIVQDLYVCWPGGNTLYLFNPNTNAWSSLALTGSAPTYSTQGVYGRFQYDYNHNVIVSCGWTTEDCRALRLTAESSLGTNFNKRKNTPGVFYSQGFDTASAFTVKTTRPDTGIFCPGATPSCSNIGQDTTLYSSCDPQNGANCGSLKYTVLVGQGGENPSGSFEIYFPNHFPGYVTTPGLTLYFQWQAQFNSNAINNLGGGGWKQYTLYNGTTGSCATLELTQTNSAYRMLPFPYTECGARSFDHNEGVPGDPVLNWSLAYPPGGSGTSTDYYCVYNNSSPSTFPGNKCPFHTANIWITFYCEVKVTTFGASTSTVKCSRYTSSDAGYRPYVYHTAYPFNSGGAPGFNVLSFTNFMTNRGTVGDTNYTTHPSPALFWVDEIIVSTAPIVEPVSSGTPPDTTPPAPPTNVTITRRQ